MVVADDQVVGDAEDGGAERAVAVADQRAVGFVDLVALVTGRAQAGAAGDGLGVGVVLDRSHLAGEVGGADDVDAGEGQQQHVGRLRQAAGDLAFQGLDFLGFSQAVVVQGQGDAAVLGGGDVAGRGLVGPVEDGLDGALLEADAGLAQGVTQGCQAGGAELLRRRGSGGAGARGSALSQSLSKQAAKPGKAASRWSRIWQLRAAPLRTRSRRWRMTQLQGGPGFVAGGFEQGEAGDGGAVDGGQVGVVGLVAGIDGLAVLLGGEGVDDAGLEAGGGEGALDEAVIAAGAFDGDEAVAEVVLRRRPGGAGRRRRRGRGGCGRRWWAG